MTKPFEPIADYTKVHNAIYRLYTRLPDFKASHALMYIYLMSQYNTEYGYAFPDTFDIALALNCGDSVVSDYKKVLVEYGLIEASRHPTFGNDVYFVNAPITDENEFYEQFPAARDIYEKRKRAFSKRRESGKLRKKAYDERLKQREKKR